LLISAVYVKEWPKALAQRQHSLKKQGNNKGKQTKGSEGRQKLSNPGGGEIFRTRPDRP
jgi:hypothetical protein